MDLKHYYSKIREMEAKIAEEFPVIVSRATDDGGQEGILTEVTRRLAAKVLVDGLARLATAEEKDGFLAEREAAKRAADQLAAAAAKVQFTVLSTADLDRLRGGSKSKS